MSDGPVIEGYSTPNKKKEEGPVVRSYVLNQMRNIRLVQWLRWVFATQIKERQDQEERVDIASNVLKVESGEPAK